MELNDRPAGRARRAAEHRLRPRRRVAVQADRPRVLLEVPHVAIHPDRRSSTPSLGKVGRRRSRERAPGLHRPGRRRRAADPRSDAAGDAQGTADRRAGAAARLERRRAKSDRGRQHPAQRLHRHVRQHARGAVSFSVPRHRRRRRCARDRVACSISGDALRYALVVTAGFRLRDAAVTGYVVIVLSVQSLKRLLMRSTLASARHG